MRLGPSALAASRGLLPVLLLGLLTLWSGTFSDGATFAGAASTHAAVLAFALLGVARWRDPLSLGSRGRYMVAALLGVLVASWLLSPVPRAGLVGLVLVPAYLLAPAAVAFCWQHSHLRGLGLWALGLLLGLVAGWALLRWQIQGSPRAAMPLGHHNLLAVWLLLIWPLGLVGAAWRGLRRLVGIGAGLLALAALTATGSFLASCAFCAQCLIAALWWKRARAWLALAVLVVWTGPGVVRWGMTRLQVQPAQAAPAVPVSGGLARTARVVSGGDTSLRARAVYARAGWRGLRERPLLGNGPGSVPWTIGRFLVPRAGLNPPSEVVGDLHSLPLQLGYETGSTGLALVAAIVLLFAWRRRSDLALVQDAVILQAALVGLVGGTLLLLGNAPVQVAAIPVGFGLVAGAALAACPKPAPGAGWPAIGLGSIYLAAALFVLVPRDRAHLAYDRAVASEDPIDALAHVRRARDLDSGFPLYRARAAWLAAGLDGPNATAAEEARRAAARAGHLAPLWLAAGALAVESSLPWAEEALERARAIDPLSPLPAFHLVRARPEGAAAVDLGARALAGDQRLAAAVFWERHPKLYGRVLEQMGVEPAVPEAAFGTAENGPTALLVQSMDAVPALSFSLFAFRRSPWPADIAPVEVRAQVSTP